MLKPTLDLFLAAFIAGAGAGLGWSIMTWLFGKLVALVDR